MKNFLRLSMICLALSTFMDSASACSLQSAQVKSQEFEIIKTSDYCSAIVNEYSEYKESLLCPLSKYDAKGVEIELTPEQCKDVESGNLTGRIVSYKDQYFLD
ncbi:MAG: hypothetical protein CME64_09430 [Halobacteriovoraceae bacterium]|nr:hypothetical protein [Halobacteriovoraceae bacterium]|tara:strand:- start:7636 stop:7944 length:309 start_codon:yes stop_codon:yes gene_type:complete